MVVGVGDEFVGYVGEIFGYECGEVMIFIERE